MARPRPTLLVAPFFLLAVGCNVDTRKLHDGAAGCDSTNSADECRPSHGGSANSSGGSGGRTAEGSGGLDAEAGATAAAGKDGGEVPQGMTGAPCTQDPDCRAVDGGPGRCLERWPGGYCSAPCVEFTDCAGIDSTLCRNVEGEDRCLTSCFGPLDCRAGYVCDPDLFGCVPK